MLDVRRDDRNRRQGMPVVRERLGRQTSQQKSIAIQAVVLRFGVLGLFAMSVMFSILYGHSFGPQHMATRWTGAFHGASVLLALAGVLAPIGLMVWSRRLTIIDPLVVLVGLPILLNSWIVY